MKELFQQFLTGGDLGRGEVPGVPLLAAQLQQGQVHDPSRLKVHPVSRGEDFSDIQLQITTGSIIKLYSKLLSAQRGEDETVLSVPDSGVFGDTQRGELIRLVTKYPLGIISL